jgi:indole-3-glycerol phosphate synthase
MISVLCDKPFFDGAYEHLIEARRGCQLALLCKEFILDECQLDAARAFGASAVLLIVRCLDDAALARLVAGSVDRGMLPLVEVFTELEAERALQAGATFIGVNARDLNTLEMHQERAESIVESFDSTVTVAHLSGIKTAESVARVAEGRADAALIGEVLMKQHDPGPILAKMLHAAGSLNPG